MISSVDGRLVSQRWSSPTRSINISEVYESVASSFQAQGWMIGRTTMAEYDCGVTESAPAPTDNQNNKTCFKGHQADRLIAVVFDPKGKLHYSSDHLQTGEHIVSVLSENVSDEYLSELRQIGVSYVFEGESQQNRFQKALMSIEELFSVKTLLLEGGGIIGYQGDNPLPAQKSHLELIDAKTMAFGMMHLHYRITNDHQNQ